jgi:hypothetical protein
MALFVVQAGAAAGSNTTKVACQIATPSTKNCIIVGFDITFDGTTATNTPIEVQLSRPTAAGSGGSTFTPLLVSNDTSVTSSTTARVNDTTAGASPVLLASWYVPPTSGFSYQFPLGREIQCKISEFYELKVVTVTGSGTPNYKAQLWFEE